MRQESTIHLILRLRGGGCLQPQMGIAAGGLIKQTIVRDTYPTESWDSNNTTTFNVSILNSRIFKQLTGLNPPQCPITARTYIEHGFPYYEIFDEKPSGVIGQFENIKSIKQLEKNRTLTVTRARRVTEADEVVNDNRVVLLDHKGRHIGFRSVSQMEKDIRAMAHGSAIGAAFFPR